jgi:hypothetical protein
MTAEIIRLPKGERTEVSKALFVTLTKRDYARLEKLADAWGVTLDEAAECLISRGLKSTT